MSTAQRFARPARVTTPTDREIHIERIFDAPRERVWLNSGMEQGLNESYAALDRLLAMLK